MVSKLLLLLPFIGSNNAANIFRPSTTNISTGGPTGLSTVNTTTSSSWTVMNVSSNSGYSVEALGDLAPGPGMLRHSPNAWVRNETAYFGITIYNETFKREDDTSYQEEVNAVLSQEMWSYDGEQFRRYCKINEYIDVGPDFFRLDDNTNKVYFEGDYSGGGKLFACHNTTVEVIHPAPDSGGSRVFNLVQFQGKLFFVGYETYEDFDRQSKALFVSDGTREGTRKVLQREVSSIETTSPGNRFVGDIEPLVEGMPKLAFYVQDEGVWVTDGTSEGTKPFLDAKRIDKISDPFNGGKFLIRAGYNGTMVTNWENETFILLDDIKLDGSLKLNATHMLFVGEKPATAWLTDGTVDGTYQFFSAEEGDFRLDRTSDDRFAISHLISGPDGRNRTLYITDGTTEGTVKRRNPFPGIEIYTGAHLPGGRTLLVPDETYNNTRLLIVQDFVNKDLLFIEDVTMPAMGRNLSRYFLKIKNDTILFFARDKKKGWLPWKVHYPPPTREDNVPEDPPSGNRSTTDASVSPTGSPTFRPLLPPPTQDTTTTLVTDMEAARATNPPTSEAYAELSRLFWASGFYLGLTTVNGWFGS